jgi:hypothetical protein
MPFNPTRKIGGKFYIYYNSYSSKKYAELKGKSLVKGNKNSNYVIREGYIKTKPYALFVH